LRCSAGLIHGTHQRNRLSMDDVVLGSDEWRNHTSDGGVTGIRPCYASQMAVQQVHRSRSRALSMPVGSVGPRAREQPCGPIASTPQFRFVDLFAGIGGFRIGLSGVGGRCAFTSEWDKHSQITYRSWFGEQPFGDINAIRPRDIPDHEVLAAGFPCQPFSLAGVSKKNALGQAHGFQCQRQGNLFFRICEIAAAKRPRILILENVKNLRSHDNGRTWSIIAAELDAIDYDAHSSVIDARGWVPQHRERLFIVCFDRRWYRSPVSFQFPTPPTAEPRLASILDLDVDRKYILSKNLWGYLKAYAERHRLAGNGFGFGLVTPDDVARTLSARYHKDGSEILVKMPRGCPRRLTPAECARLMGFNECVAKRFGFQQGFPIVVSDTQAYRQFGNSVVPQVVEAIAREIAPFLATPRLRRPRMR
jgi:DNA (cytosine-5)-methyltransferase 1